MNRQYTFHVKSVGDAGEFSGITAVYENVDLGGDRIKPGAFTKTLNESGGRVPLLADHRIPIGAAYLADSADGLTVKGVLNLGKEVARETLSDIKFYMEKSIPYGMSFGYDVVKSDREGDVRNLTELKVYESSVTLFPMNPAARVLALKSREDLDGILAELKELKAFFSSGEMKELAAVAPQLTALLQKAADGTFLKPAASHEPVTDHSQLEKQFKNLFQGVINKHGKPNA